MAVITFKPRYLNTADAIYDKAQSNPYFNENDFQALNQQNIGSSYLNMMAAYDAPTMNSKGVSMRDLSYLEDSTDRLLYIQNKVLGDTGQTENIDGQDVNVWQAQNEYLNYKIQQAKDLEYYNNLSTIQKIANHIVGFADNIGYSLIQSIEGLVDLGALAVGTVGEAFGNKGLAETTKSFVAEDTLTSYHKSVDEWLSKNTEFDRNGFLKVTRDIISTVVPIVATWGTATVGTAIGSATTKAVTKYIGKTVTQGAQKAYWAQMAGQFGQEYLRNNPSGDMIGAAAYAATMTGIERATEGLSAVFGKTTSLDKVLGLKSAGASMTGMNGVGFALRKLGLNMGLEGLEEMVSEFVGSIAYKIMVDPSASLATFNDILYAGFIGAIIGGGMHGLTVGTTRAKALDKQGNLVDADKTNTELRNLTKTQTLEFQNFLGEINNKKSANNVQRAYEKAASKDASIKSIEDFKGKYAEEYRAAQEKDTEIMQDVVQRSVALSELLSAIGVEQFTKSTEVLNDQLKAQYEAIRTYASAQSQVLTEGTRKALEVWQKKHPNFNVEVSMSLSDDERAIQRAFAGTNIYVIFGKLGSKDGKAQPAIQLEQGTLIIQKDLTNTLSREQILNEVIKKTLNDNLALQLKNASKNNRVKLEVKKQYYQALYPKATDYYILQCVKDGKDLTDEQIKQICNSMLYNELTADAVFHTSKNLFKRIINFLTGETRKNRLKKQTQYTQLEYHELMSRLNTYRQVCDAMGISDLPNDLSDESKNAFAFFTDGSFTIPENDLTFDQYHFYAAQKTLDSNRITQDDSYLDATTYSDDFVNSINPEHDAQYYALNPTEFGKDLNTYLDSNFHVMLDPATEKLVYAIQYEKIFNFDLFDKNGEVKIPVRTIQGKPLSFFIKPEILNRFSPELQEALNTYTVNIVRRKATGQANGNTDIQNQIITVNTPLNANASADEVVEVIRHEMNHVIMQAQGLDFGSSESGIMQVITESIIQIANKNASKISGLPVYKIVKNLNLTQEERQLLIGIERVYYALKDSGEYEQFYEDDVELPDDATLEDLFEYRDAIARFVYVRTSGEIASRTRQIIDYLPVTNAQYFQNTDFFRVTYTDNGTRITGKSIGTDRLNDIDFVLPDAIMASSEQIETPAKETEAITGDYVKNLTEEDLRAMPKEKLEQVRKFITNKRNQYFAKYALWSKNPKELTELQQTELKEHLEKLKQKRNKKAKKQLKELYDNNKLTEKEVKDILAKLEKPMENPYQQRDNWVELFEEEHPTTARLYRMINDIWEQRGFATATTIIKTLAPEEISEQDRIKRVEGWTSAESQQAKIKSAMSLDAMENYISEDSEEDISASETISDTENTWVQRKSEINWDSYEDVKKLIDAPHIKDNLSEMSFEDTFKFMQLLERETKIVGLAQEWENRAKKILQNENVTETQYDDPESVLEIDPFAPESKYTKYSDESKQKQKHILNTREKILRISLRAYKPIWMSQFKKILNNCKETSTLNSVYHYIRKKSSNQGKTLVLVLGEKTLDWAIKQVTPNANKNIKNSLEETKEEPKKSNKSTTIKIEQPKVEETSQQEKVEQPKPVKEQKTEQSEPIAENKPETKKEPIKVKHVTPIETREERVKEDGTKETLVTRTINGKTEKYIISPVKKKETPKAEKTESKVEEKPAKPKKSIIPTEIAGQQQMTMDLGLTKEEKREENRLARGTNKNIRNSKEYVAEMSAANAEYREQVKKEKKLRFSQTKDTRNNLVVTKDGTVRQQCVFTKAKGNFVIKGTYTESFEQNVYEGTNFTNFVLTNKNGDLLLNVDNGKVIENNVSDDIKHDVDAFIGETYHNIYYPDVDLTTIAGYTKRIGDAINTEPEDYEKTEAQMQTKECYPRLAYKEFIKKNKLVDATGLPTLTDADAEAFLTFLKSGNLQALSINQQKNALKLCMFFVVNANSFKKSIVRQIETMYEMIVSVSASVLGYWSGLFKREMTLDMLREQFKNMFGKELVIDKDLEQKYLNARANNDFDKAKKYEEELLKIITEQLPDKKYNFLEKGLSMEDRAKRFALLVGKINGFRYMAMLSNISTHVLNYMSNAMLTAQDVLENKLLGWVTERTDKYYDQYKQWKYASKDPVTKETRDWVKDTFGGQIDYITRKGKYTSTPDNTLVDEALNQNQYRLKILQKWHDAIFNSLRESDRKFVAPRLTSQIAQIVQANWGNDYSKITDIDKQIIMENATNRVMLLYLRREGGFTRIINDLKSRNPALNLLLGAIVPFPKVLESTTIQILKHSPFGLARGLVRWFMLTKKGYTVDSTKKGLAKYVKVEFDKNGNPKNMDPFYLADTQEQIVQGSMGTAMMLIGLVLNLLGLLVFDDDDEYGGIVLKIGDVKVNISTLSPTMTPITIGASLGFTAQYPNLLDRVARTFNDATLFGTFDSLFGNTSLGNFVASTTSNYFTQYVPSLFRAISKMGVDQTKVSYDYNSIGGWFSTTWNRILSSLPLINMTLPKKINPYTGQPYKYYNSTAFSIINMLLPTKLSLDMDNALSIESKRLNAETTGTTGNFKINGQDYHVRGKDLEDMQRNRGTAINDLLTEFYNDERVYTIIVDGKERQLRYSQMTDEQRKTVVNRIYNNATEYAKALYWIKQGHSYQTSSRDTLIDIGNIFGVQVNYRKNKGTVYIE